MARGPRPLAGMNEAGAVAPARKDLVLMGEFGRAHGLKGELRLKSHTGDPLAIASYGPLLLADGRSVALASVRQAAGDQPDLLVARVEGVQTREAAEALNRAKLFVPREKLGEPEDQDEYFLADLIGLPARSEAGEELGSIVGVPNYGGGDLLEIAPPRGPTILVPFTKEFVPGVDLKGGFVTVAEEALAPGSEAESEAEKAGGAEA